MIASVVALAGCYAPSLRDCTVTCGGEADCASGQVCTTTGWCAGPTATCSATGATVDAAAGADARIAVDAAGPDARETDQLTVIIAGTGDVTVDGIGTCSGNDQQMSPAGTCVYAVPAGVQLTAHAEATGDMQSFDKWSDPLCKTQGATCLFTPPAIATIQAHFK